MPGYSLENKFGCTSNAVFVEFSTGMMVFHFRGGRKRETLKKKVFANLLCHKNIAFDILSIAIEYHQAISA